MSTYNQILKLMKSEQNFVVATVIKVEGEESKAVKPGDKFVYSIKADSLSDYKLPTELKDKISTAAKSVYEQKKAALLTIKGISLFFEPVIGKERLLVFGGGHVALPVVKIGAMLGFSVTVVDDRISFANESRFPEADQIICKPFEDAFKESLTLTDSDYIVIITRGHQYDYTCLEQALTSSAQPAYIGMIGSKRRVKGILEKLKGEGIPEESIEQIYSPIGLDIGGENPEEIAVSIMAEIIQVKRQGRGKR